MRRLESLTELFGPALLVVLVGLLATVVSRSTEVHVLDAIVSVAIVVAIYVFVGNSGVLSFGQISFVAVGAFCAGVLTVPLELKAAVLPELFPVRVPSCPPLGGVGSLAAPLGMLTRCSGTSTRRTGCQRAFTGRRRPVARSWSREPQRAGRRAP